MSNAQPSGPALPLVVIAGRPNVGKSALFNRLLGRRTAIVHHSSGVTRDRLTHQVKINDREVMLTDTGGLASSDSMAGLKIPEWHQAISGAIHQQAEAALRMADMVIMVVDLQAGLIAPDEEVAALLRRLGIPTLLAVNKSDSPAHDAMTGDFHRLGFPVFPVSALHNRGLSELKATIEAGLPPVELTQPAPERLKITIVGRPNVGKSSFINSLLRDNRLIVSEMPGTTRDCVDVPFSFNRGGKTLDYLLTDTAGIRKTSRIKAAPDHIGLRLVERQIDRADVVILMLDAAQGPTAQDKTIARLILDHAKGLVIALNKWDLTQSYATVEEGVEAVREVLPFLEFVPIYCVSAHSGFNLRRTLVAATRVAEETRRKLPTGPLNRALTKAAARLQPPMVKGRRLKVFYAAQTGVQPLIITLFVNAPDRLTKAYATFLIRQIRLEFGLEGVPVVLKVRSSHQKNDTETTAKTASSTFTT